MVRTHYNGDEKKQGEEEEEEYLKFWNHEEMKESKGKEYGWRKEDREIMWKMKKIINEESELREAK